MTETRPEDDELRSLTGMAGPAASVMLALLLLTIGAMMQRHLVSAGNHLLVASCYLLLAAAATVVLRAPGDPLPLRAGLPVAAVGPVTTWMSLHDGGGAAAPDYVPWQATPYALVLSVLILRGRPCLAWAAISLSGVAFVIIAATDGVSSATVLASLAAVGTVLGVTVFALIMRPTLKSLRALRDEAAARAAAEATMAAQSEERDRQLDRLDALARPMLDKIAAGTALTAAEREQCMLLEAELRDSLRAPRLAVPVVAAAARMARGRGVEVVLLDDGGFAAAGPDARAVVLAEAERALLASRDGTVTVRVLPSGKRYLASVLVSASDQDRRTEIAHDGATSMTVESPDLS